MGGGVVPTCVFGMFPKQMPTETFGHLVDSLTVMLELRASPANIDTYMSLFLIRIQYLSTEYSIYQQNEVFINRIQYF